jgi:hypothetical protein
MDDNTYRLVHAVWVPLLSAGVTVAFGGVIGLIGARFGAKLAETQARAAELRALRLQAIEHTFEVLERDMLAFAIASELTGRQSFL